VSALEPARRTGMTIALPWLGVEAAVRELARMGFDAAEIFLGQVRPGPLDLEPSEAQAAAVGELVRGLGVHVGFLNTIVDPAADPVGAPDEAAHRLARDLRLADAMGAEGVLMWDGFVPEPDSRAIASAAQSLASVVERGRRLSGLTSTTRVTVELHPFTWALRHRRVAELAEALARSGAGICVDYCHFAVALGRDFLDALEAGVLACVNHVHWSDSDCETSEVHFPPGRGVLDLDGIDRHLRGAAPSVAWDLFGWPAPLAALAQPEPFARAVQTLTGRKTA
jgi:sugar phosphate isomerase/epimerase